MDVPEAQVELAAAILADSEHVVAFTGAGVSTESGIPDFRSEGGIWDHYDPSDFTIDAFRRDPTGYWERNLERREEMEFDWDTVEPNPAHEAIARLEQRGPLSSVITQNVDGLHQAAGNDDANVLELHGTRHEAKCLDCDQRFPVDELERKLDAEPLPPRCATCEGLVKRATVSFGEALPRDTLQRAQAEALASDCFLVVGSSLTVEPAASLPRTASENGAMLIIVNLDSTPMDAEADAVIQAKAGEALPRLIDRSVA